MVNTDEDGVLTPADNGVSLDTPEQLSSIISTGDIGGGYRARIDEITRLGGYSGLRTMLTDAYMGTNVYNTYTPAQLDNSQYGLIFFTRPRMNLTRENIIFERTLHPLLTTDINSDAAAIRCYLDPESQRVGLANSNKVLSDSPWIHLLGNHCISMTGWPDVIVDTYKSGAGLYNQEWVMYDGFPKLYGSWDATMTFRNMTGNPILNMMNYWTQYGARVHEGVLNPYFDSLFENELDYITRIFVMTLDNSRTKITGISSTMAIPTANPMGEIFNFDRSKVHNDNIDQLSYQFTCVGAEYNDPILYREFNDITCIFNEGMMPNARNGNYIKIPPHQLSFFNFLAIPWINLDTNEIEWYVSRSMYNEITEMGKRNGY